MSASENIANKAGEIAGKTANFIKRAPNKTVSKTKSIKSAFVDGIKSTNSGKKTRDFDDVFE